MQGALGASYACSTGLVGPPITRRRAVIGSLAFLLPARVDTTYDKLNSMGTRSGAKSYECYDTTEARNGRRQAGLDMKRKQAVR